MKNPVYVILQMRKFTDSTTREEVLGSLLTLQTIPPELFVEADSYRALDRTIEILTPALYVETDYDQEKETILLKHMTGWSKKDELKNRQALLECDWNIDVVLCLRQLDETLDKNGTGRLTAFVEPKKPPTGYSTIDGVWKPDGPDAEKNGRAALESCVCIPWVPPWIRYYGAKNKKCVLYLLKGENARSALISISDKAWRRTSVRNILLAGGPGAGKEVAALLIHAGRAKNNFKAISIGGSSWNNMEIAFLGQGQPGSARTLLTGFVEESRNGTLLVDETDKADRSIRDALLRVLESDEFHRPHSGERVDISGPSRPLFVFAGSGEGAAVDKHKKKEKKLDYEGTRVDKMSRIARMELEYPPDFWQRMDVKIELKHPYKNTDQNTDPKRDDDESVFDTYVKYFLNHARGSLRLTDYSPFISDRLLFLTQDIVDSQIGSQWCKFTAALQDALKKNTVKTDLPNLRIVRSAASMLFEKISHKAMCGELMDITDKKIKKLAEEAVDNVKNG